MRKSLKKIWFRLLVLLVLGAMLLTLSPLLLLIDLKPTAVSSPARHTAIFVAGKTFDWLAGLPPRTSHQEITSYFPKTLTQVGVFNFCACLTEVIGQSAQAQDYSRANDLQFNLPRLTYRQPSSEHSSEG